MTGPGELRLSIPADPRYVRVARLFAAGIATGAGADEETVADLKIAVSEAATSALEARLTEDVVIEVLPGDTVMDVTVRGCGPMSNGDLGSAVLSALFPDVRLQDEGPAGTTVRFTVPIAPTG